MTSERDDAEATKPPATPADAAPEPAAVAELAPEPSAAPAETAPEPAAVADTESAPEPAAVPSTESASERAVEIAAEAHAEPVAEIAAEPAAATATEPEAPPEPAPPTPPTIATIEPAHGPLTGCKVTIHGERFEEGCLVRFGESDLTPTRDDDCTLHVDAPLAPEARDVDIRVTNPDGQSEIRVCGFHYDSPPTIARITPSVISTARGGPLSIFGIHFKNGCKLSIGSVDVLAIVDPDCIRALAPPGSEGLMDITITNPDGQRAHLPGSLRYTEGPVVTGVVPAEAPLDGGVELTIMGRGFQPGCAVTLFDEHAPEVRFDDDTCVRVTSPRRSESGAGAVRVTNPDGLAHSLPGALLVQVSAAPILQSVSPTRGSIGGSTRLTIVGSGFDPKCAVFLGEAAGAVTFENDKLLHVVTPAVAGPTEVDVRVENPGGQIGLLAKGFTFTPVPTPPKLISITPPRAFVSGGSKVTIAGDNFDEGTAVRIGEVRVTVRLVSRTILEADVPARAEPGAVAVELIADGVVVRTEDIFHYDVRPGPKVTSVTPKNGPTTGGTRLTIEGENFHESSYVRIGRDAPKSVVSRKADQIVVITPPNRTAGMVDIEVGSEEAGADVMKNAFRYDAQPAPTISSVSPVRGAVGGNTEINIDGKNFLAGVVVLVGGKPATKVKLVSATSIEARTPAGQAGSMADVVVQNPDGKEAVVKRAFLYDERFR